MSAAAAAEVSPRRRRRRFLVGYDEGEIAVKREPADEDIKDYAETTMNELLGWYGYEKVDSRDTQGLNLTHFASSTPSNGVSPPSSAASDASDASAPPDSASPEAPEVSSTASDEVARLHQQMVSALSTITKHPGAPDSPNLPPGCIVCAWCQKVGMKLFTLQTPTGCKVFCSELCFTQCRRAAFKKNKICDWCKHVRHTVNYVDFKDGEQQLQFCSDKCLNQYKMNIFCKETRAHLHMHTHLKEAACKMAAGGNLITPELWLRDCEEGEDPPSDLSSPPPQPPAVSPKPPTPPPPIVVAKKDKPDEQKTKKKHHSPKKQHSPAESKPSHSKREKKANGLSEPRRSPIQATSPRNNPVSNGTSLLSPPPPVPRPPPPSLVLPPRHCPPVPSPLNMEQQQQHPRQPFFHPNMMPPPFQLLAQQQMEAIFRSQHGMDLRSKIPPPLPIPPWGMPPFHHPPPPHLVPPPPPLSSKSPSSHQHSSPPSRNPHHSKNHKQKHHKHSSSRSSSNHPHKSPSSATAEPPPVFPSSALPPVTVMVPFPLVLPVPLPIPVPIPIPPDLMRKFARQMHEQSSDEPPKSDVERKRKNSNDIAKLKKKRRSSAKESHEDHPPAKRSSSPEKPYDPIENLSIRTPGQDQPHPAITLKVSRSDLDPESRSYSPLTDVTSSNDEEENTERTLKNGDANDFSSINFSQFNLNLVRSSPSMQASERHFGLSSAMTENSESQSPTNLSVKDRLDIMSSNIVNFKKKHLHDQLSLMT